MPVKWYDSRSGRETPLGPVPYAIPVRIGCTVRYWPYLLERSKALEYVRLGVHIWVSVLIMGTMWRLLQYHLVASDNQTWQHVGRAMALQY